MSPVPNLRDRVHPVERRRENRIGQGLRLPGLQYGLKPRNEPKKKGKRKPLITMRNRRFQDVP